LGAIAAALIVLLNGYLLYETLKGS
jgi:hypothetical protein